MQLSKIFSGVLVLLLAPLAMAVPLNSEANIVPRSDNRIFVGGLPFDTSSETLKSMLAQSGHVINVHIISDTKGRPRGMAIVTMGSAADASQAVSHWNGHSGMKVTVCTPRVCPR